MNTRLAWIGPVLLLGWTACQSSQSMRQLPVELLGEWRTSDPRYGDRTFELQAHNVVFNTGNGTFTARHIVSMDSIVEHGLIQFRLLYDAGASTLFHFDFSYDPEADVIRFRNQPQIVWYRTVRADSTAGPPGRLGVVRRSPYGPGRRRRTRARASPGSETRSVRSP